MDFTKEIFKRATIRGVADYLLYGLGQEEDDRSYEEGLDDSYLEYEKLALQCDKDKQFELLNLANAMASESASVYAEIGIQAGILLMKDMIQNITGEKRDRKAGQEIEQREKQMSRITDLLKLAADSMKNRTLTELLEKDTEYLKRLEEEKQALKAVDELDLTEEQRNVIDTFIDRKGEREYDYHINSYMAGMLDAYEVLKQFDLTKE